MANGVVKTPAAVTRYLATIGTKGGKAISPRKALASAANGRKGGRPKTNGRCIRCNTDYSRDEPCHCGARASLRDSR